MCRLKPEVVVSFVTRTNVLTLLACTGLALRVIVSERVDPRAHRETALWSALRTATYRCADAVVVQTESVLQWFRNRLGKRSVVIVIPNPVTVSRNASASQPTLPQPFLLAAGRLVAQKGFDILIRAFAHVALQSPQLRLVIAGEGPALSDLRFLVTELELTERVSFVGEVQDLPGLMRQAMAFILASRYEGFPNVLLEALASELPVVATDCPSGPREILHDGEFGLLVPCEDPSALACAMQRLVRDPELRVRLSASASAAIEPYAPERVVAAWERLVESPRVARR
jgi:glycosyltransferase involved in cell wall biosynthesis